MSIKIAAARQMTISPPTTSRSLSKRNPDRAAGGYGLSPPGLPEAMPSKGFKIQSGRSLCGFWEDGSVAELPDIESLIAASFILTNLVLNSIKFIHFIHDRNRGSLGIPVVNSRI